VYVISRRVLSKDSYALNPKAASIMLLGRVIARRVLFGEKYVTLRCLITETEAYFGANDPASRAVREGDLKNTMCGSVGRALVYGVHANWLFNVVAHEPGECGAILVRSCEPLEGIEVMMSFRRTRLLKNLTVGPGRLTKALLIDKSFHKRELYVKRYGLWIEEGASISLKEVESSKRVGVTRDLEDNLRFYIRFNQFVSKRTKAF